MSALGARTHARDERGARARAGGHAMTRARAQDEMRSKVLVIQETLSSDKSGVAARLNAEKLKIILSQTILFRGLDFIAIMLCVVALVRWSRYLSSARYMKAAWASMCGAMCPSPPLRAVSVACWMSTCIAIICVCVLVCLFFLFFACLFICLFVYLFVCLFVDHRARRTIGTSLRLCLRCSHSHPSSTCAGPSAARRSTSCGSRVRSAARRRTRRAGSTCTGRAPRSATRWRASS